MICVSCGFSFVSLPVIFGVAFIKLNIVFHKVTCFINVLICPYLILVQDLYISMLSHMCRHIKFTNIVYGGMLYKAHN